MESSILYVFSHYNNFFNINCENIHIILWFNIKYPLLMEFMQNEKIILIFEIL
jgi:hypothetical protein